MSKHQGSHSFLLTSNAQDIVQNEETAKEMVLPVFRAKGNKKVLLAKSNTNDGNQQSNNDNNLITLE